jgi:hypothetical protein
LDGFAGLFTGVSRSKGGKPKEEAIMDRHTSIRVIGATALVLAAIGLGTTMHLPALAAAEYQQFVGPNTASSCTSTTPCLQWTNTNTGAGMQGISKKGNGSVGQTAWKSTSASNAKSGVLGQDISTTGTFDMGVLGTSTKGTGVRGTSTSGTGIQGTSTSGNGVVALSSAGSALFAESTGYSDGAQMISLNNDGTNSSTQNPSLTTLAGRSGLWGHDDSSDGGRLNVGVAGSSTNGIGVSASSSGYVALNAVGGAFASTTHVPALSVVGGSQIPVFLMMACSSASDNPCTLAASSRVFTLNSGGDIFINGFIYTSGSCSTGCAVGRNGDSHRVESYAPSQTVPSIDDFGEAQLVSGHAYVRLSADFANVIDKEANYLVFITPEGDSRGVYVSDKTRVGFTVRENQGGHSTLAFSYRIVAKPYNVNKPRLPMETVGSNQTASAIHRTR